MRICSLLPSATEILCALGLGNAIVGVSHECDYPPAVRQKSRVVRAVIDQALLSSAAIDRTVRTALRQRECLYHIDETALQRAQPDLIVTQSLCEVCALDALHVEEVVHTLIPEAKIISLHAHMMSELFSDIRRLGHVTNRNAEAGRLVTHFVKRMDSVQRRLHGVVRPRVCCLEWLEPPMASGHWVPEMVECAGGVEVLGRAGAPSRYVSGEEIVASHPEELFLMPCGFPIERTRRELALLTSQSWWSGLPAVRTGRVHLVDGPAYFNRCGPRLIDGIELLASLLHPDRCSDLLPSTTAVAGL